MSKVALLKNNRRLWISGALVAVVAAGLGSWLAFDGEAGDAPEDVVTAYLEAIRAGDVTAAQSLTAWSPDSDSGAFMTDAALDTEWVIDSASEIEGGEDRARVQVTISSPQAGQAEGVFDLIAEADSWRLDMPYVEVGFSDVGLDYLDVNGQRHVPSNHPAYQRYFLFPGLYHFYAADNPAIDIAGEPRLLLPGGDPTRIDAEVAVTEAGMETAQEAVNDYIDECAAAGAADDNGCPFALDGMAVESLIGVEYVNDVRNLEWVVEEYPLIEVRFSDGRFEVIDAEPGEIEVSATATERLWDGQEREFYDGDDIDFTVDCRIEARWLELAVGYDGSWAVRHFADFEDEYDWRPGSVVETCGSAPAW